MPKVSQKAPKDPKTTKGKVLPMIHCDVLVSVSKGVGFAFPDGAKSTYLSERTEEHEDTTERII
jgi:hypothetical protein